MDAGHNEEFFQSALDFAQDGILLSDPAGRYLYANAVALEQTGYLLEELKALSISDLLPEEELARLPGHLERLRNGELVTDVWMLQRKDGDRFHAELSTRMLPDGRYMAVARKIYGGKCQNRCGLISRSHLGSWWLDVSSDQFNWSDENFRIYGMEPGTPPSRDDIVAAIHPDDRAAMVSAWEEGLRGVPYDAQYRILVDGQMKWLRERASMEYAADGSLRCLAGSTQDITDIRESEAYLARSSRMLRELASHRERVREEERARIAHEIHDELGQLLTALKMDVSLLRMKFGDNPELLEKAGEMRVLVEKTISTVRHIASNLRPAVLDLGIVPALEWLAGDFQRHYGLHCSLDIQADEVALDDARATAIFRIAQESLTNVARHAQACAVVIALSKEEGWLRLRVQDNGRGFDPATVRNMRSFGLFGMRERASSLNGTLKIDSAIGQGTALTVKVPLSGNFAP